MLNFVFYLSIFFAAAQLIDCTYSTLDMTCGEVEKVKDFSYSKFSSIWFNYALTPDAIHDNQICNIAVGYDIIFNIFWPMGVTYKAEDCEDCVPESRLDLHYANGNQPDGFSTQGHYYAILATDYTSYAVLFTCNTPLSNEILNVWLWTRDNPADQEVIDKAESQLSKINVSPDQLQKIDQHCVTLNK